MQTRINLGSLILFLFSSLGLNLFALGEESKIPQFKKVVLVLFENEDFEKPLSQPFFTKLSKEGALLTNYHAVAHPSQPNYIALTSGDVHGVLDDENHDLNVNHLGDLLDAKKKTWKNYAENYPGNCFLGVKQTRYVRKHTPFLSYTNVNKTDRCKNIVDSSQFETDVKNGTLPDFSFFTPNMDNDVHDTDIAYGEKWFKGYFGPLLKQPGFKDVLLIVTFDENECNTVGPYVTAKKIIACKGDTNRVYTVFYGNQVKAGSESATNYNHFSLLKTIEKGFGLGNLGANDVQANTITGIWNFN